MHPAIGAEGVDPAGAGKRSESEVRGMLGLMTSTRPYVRPHGKNIGGTTVCGTMSFYWLFGVGVRSCWIHRRPVPFRYDGRTSV